MTVDQETQEGSTDRGIGGLPYMNAPFRLKGPAPALNGATAIETARRLQFGKGMRSRVRNQLEQAATFQVTMVAAAIVAGLLAMSAYASHVGGDLGWRTFALLSAFSLASFMAGGVLGFLFGIPRFIRLEQVSDKTGAGGGLAAGQQESTLTPNTALPNTNLEQISDWLTKVLVGATLTQIGNIPSAASRLFAEMGSAMGVGTSGNAMAGALTIFFFAFGFMVGWLATRTWVGRMLTAADKQP